jgi:hypothetical protein
VVDQCEVVKAVEERCDVVPERGAYKRYEGVAVGAGHDRKKVREESVPTQPPFNYVSEHRHVGVRFLDQTSSSPDSLITNPDVLDHMTTCVPIFVPCCQLIFQKVYNNRHNIIFVVKSIDEIEVLWPLFAKHTYR